MSHQRNLPVVAFGPAMPGWGSWEWVGADLVRELSPSFETVSFDGPPLPDCDVVVVVKHAPAIDAALRGARHAAVIFCPVDNYDSAAAIDADGAMLRRCARIVVHCERLRRYFAPYAPVDYMDHHVKFAAPMRETHHTDGFVLWVGVRSNVPFLAEWLARHPLGEPLVVLTNFEDPHRPIRPDEVGLANDGSVRIENWSAERHMALVTAARAALDVKGDDFRQRHKPPAKAIDFLASGCPVAANPGSSVAEHLERLGFSVATPLEPDRWFSRAYWEETRRFAPALRELLSLERVGRRFARLINETLAARRR